LPIVGPMVKPTRSHIKRPELFNFDELFLVDQRLEAFDNDSTPS
jgi:hypothetical protein